MTLKRPAAGSIYKETQGGGGGWRKLRLGEEDKEFSLGCADLENYLMMEYRGKKCREKPWARARLENHHDMRDMSGRNHLRTQT